jgi:hypothetical protein
MHRMTMLCCLLLLAFSCENKALSQEAAKAAPETAKSSEAPVHYYHLEFVVQELGETGKVVNSRSYATTTSTDRTDAFVSIRTGSKVPIQIAAENIQYMDVGINFDVHKVHEINGKLAFDLSAELSNLAAPAGVSQPSTPVVRNNRWQAPVLVPLNKPTVVFTSDSLDTKGSMQIVLTATLVQ